MEHVLHKMISQGNARILCHPICSGEGDLEAVVEFVRTHGNAFTEDEIEVQCTCKHGIWDMEVISVS